MAFELEIAPGTISSEDFDYFRSKLRKLTGIQLSDAKRELLQSRLRERIRELRLAGFEGYRSYLERFPGDDPEWQVMINLLTTNKTEWFREPGHFEYLIREFLPRWKSTGKNRLSVWCAACSTGEEAYSLAMVLSENLGKEFSYEISATDIDTEVLKFANAGVYPVSKLEQIPENYRSKSFAMGTGDIASWARVKQSLKASVKFQQHNLADAAFPWAGRFDLIFCRNVFIYFPKEVIESAVRNFYEASAPSAQLVIGHSESLQGVRSSWKYLGASVYEKGPKASGKNVIFSL
jgi:chemotaxis methyl-accepting protein methylase